MKPSEIRHIPSSEPKSSLFGNPFAGGAKTAMMLPSAVRVFLAPGGTDLRKSINILSFTTRIRYAAHPIGGLWIAVCQYGFRHNLTQEPLSGLEAISFFCITMWLPRRRTSTKPCLDKIAHTSLPERTRSLPNCYLNLGYKNLAMKTLLDLFG